MTIRYVGRWLRRRLRPVEAAAFVLAMTILVHPVSASDAMTVVLDQAKVAKLPDRVATVVIGNPLIADVALQAGGTMVITGKGYGVTNVISLDRSGAILSEISVQVVGPYDHVVIVYRGANRESYSCSPSCERRITLGDTPEFFNATIGQTGVRNNTAKGGATPGPSR